MNKLVKRFHCKKRRSENRLDIKTNTEQTETSTITEEYLTNRNLSIMTDTQPESDVVDNACVRQEKSSNRRTTNSSSSTSSQDSYILISTEETPVLLKDTNWEYVGYHDIIEVMQSQSKKMKKYCSPRCSTAWFLKIRRDILKNCRNKVYPVATKG